MSIYIHQERYAKTTKGKAARRRAMDNWNAKRREMRAKERAAVTDARAITKPVSSVFQLGAIYA